MAMKMLTIAVPCYNSEAYMRRCIDSLLPGGEDVEILIIDDGSTKDRTAEIADAYAREYPGMIRAIHQENKGHGGAVNMAVAHAEGLFFKVVDSDDWVDLAAYRRVLSALRRLIRGGAAVDAVLTNYVYEKEGARRKRVMHYEKYLPTDRIFTWREMRPLGLNKYILMHSIIYRTQLLHDVGLRLPEHTFYVDNIYAYEPFVAVQRMYYLNVNFYRYYIGRADQSVNETVMIGRIDQQLKVNNRMIDFMRSEGRKAKGNQWRFLMHELTIIMAVSSVLLIRSRQPDALEKKRALWQRLKKADGGAYLWIRGGLLGFTMNLPGPPGRKVTEIAYMITQKLYGFN